MKVAVDEDKEVKRGLEEDFIIHRSSICNCYTDEVARGLDVLGF